MIQIKVDGLDKLKDNFAKSPAELARHLSNALGLSIAMVETESKRRTPVATGYLKSSIGGSSDGFKYVRGLTAGVGTNVRYAIFVHEGFGRHKSGERKFMEKGADASKEFIAKVFGEALEKVAISIIK